MVANACSKKKFTCIFRVSAIENMSREYFHTLLLNNNCHIENEFTRAIIQPLQFTQHRSNSNMCVYDVLANSMSPFDIKHTENTLPIQYYYIILSRQHHIIRHQITIAGECAVFNHQVVVRGDFS